MVKLDSGTKAANGIIWRRIVEIFAVQGFLARRPRLFKLYKLIALSLYGRKTLAHG